jgi:hypothetical protein
MFVLLLSSSERSERPSTIEVDINDEHRKVPQQQTARNPAVSAGGPGDGAEK